MGIKLIHTSDWHLGKRLFNRERIDEQQDFLDWLLDTIKNENIDLLLLAGDIFDVPSPPHAALSLFNTFIERFIKETKSQMVFITGNHDSGSLLESLKPLWNKERIHLKGNLSLDFNEHYFDYTKDDESVRVSLLPFFRNYEIEKWSRQHEETDLTQLLKKFFNQAIVDRPRANHFHILLAHHLFCEFESSVSEQSISLSGLDSIPKELLKDCYDYLALGHIHKYQKISSAPLGIYTGSPIAFRFSETSVKKVNLLEITNNKLNLIALEIPCERKLIKLKLTNYNYVDEIKKLLETHSSNKYPSFLEVEIEMDKPQVGIADTIRDLLTEHDIECLNITPIFQGQGTIENSIKIEELSIFELFAHHYENKFGNSEIPESIILEFKDIVDEAQTSTQQEIPDTES